MSIIDKSPTDRTPLERHPTTLKVLGRGPLPVPGPLTAAAIRTLALEAGADDAALVSLDHPDLAGERPHVLAALPTARSLVSLVLRTHPENIRSPKRSLSNHAFHQAGEALDEVATRVAKVLSARGYPSVNPPVSFPMEMESFPGRTWVVSHKPVAVAAQLGRIGLHRSVIHPVFGSFILLATVITEATADEAPAPLPFNPCLDCKLCVAACPVGAIEPAGAFRFSACLDHNYREFMTGFSDFVEEVADSRDRADFRDRVPLSETVSMWQSLAYRPNYKAAYCIAVCPAGEEVIPPFLASRAAHLETTLRPLTERVETVFVVAGSDAEAHVKRRFPHKKVRVVKSSLRPTSVRGLFRGLPLTFQRGPAKGWNATFHFELVEDGEPVKGTVRIEDGTLAVEDGLVGHADVTVRGPGQVWLDVVSKRRHPVVALLTRRLKVTGDVRLLPKFAACFPR